MLDYIKKAKESLDYFKETIIWFCECPLKDDITEREVIEYRDKLFAIMDDGEWLLDKLKEKISRKVEA